MVATIQDLALFQRGIGARALCALNLYDLVSVRKPRPVEFQYAVTALSMGATKAVCRKILPLFWTLNHGQPVTRLDTRVIPVMRLPP